MFYQSNLVVLAFRKYTSIMKMTFDNGERWRMYICIFKCKFEMSFTCSNVCMEIFVISNVIWLWWGIHGYDVIHHKRIIMREISFISWFYLDVCFFRWYRWILICWSNLICNLIFGVNKIKRNKHTNKVKHVCTRKILHSNPSLWLQVFQSLE